MLLANCIRRVQCGLYADLLVGYGRYDIAKTAREKVLELSQDEVDGQRTAVRARNHLSLVLRELGLDAEVQLQRVSFL